MLADTIDRWFEEAEARGEARGSVQTTRRNLLSYLEIKMRGVPARLRSLIQGLSDEGGLDQALQTACSGQDVRDSLPKLRRLLEGSCG